MDKRKIRQIATVFLFWLLSALFLMIVGCWGDDNTTTYTVSGNVTIDGNAFANVTVNLTGSATSSATTDSSGNFSFSAANGTYTLTPSFSGYTFNPVSTVVVIDGANITYIDFDATYASGDTYDISGTITGAVQSGVKLTLSSSSQSGTVMSNSDGTYAFTNLVDGYTYTVTPSLSGYSFDPTYSANTISAANITGVDFTSSSK